MQVHALQAVRTWAAAAALAITVLFALLVVGLSGAGIGLHEVAGVLLLALIGTGLYASLRLRRIEPRTVSRWVTALGVLVGVGTLGGLLAIGVLPLRFSFLPLLGLGVLGVLLADAIRLSLRGGARRPSDR